MKSYALLLMLFFIGGFGLFAQTPDLINYQAIVRDASGLSVTNQVVGVQIKILEGSPTGTEVFAETHSPTTNSYGLINLQIGNGTLIGPALSTIDWSANIYYIQVEIDPAGGTNYSISSTTQLVSVPYALHARTAEFVDDADADPANEYNTSAVLNVDTLEITDGGGTLTVDLSSLGDDADADPGNEIQNISKAGNTITLSNGGGSVTDDVDDADNDPSNEYNTGASLAGTVLTITDGGGNQTVDLNVLGDDADADPTNEYNTGVSLTGTTLTVTDAGGGQSVDLSPIQDGVNDADADPTNEYNTGVTLVGTTLTVNDAGGGQSVDLSPIQDGVNDADADPTNEYNTGVTLVGTTLTVNDGGGGQSVDLSPIQDGVDDADNDPNNEIQTLSIVGQDLSISGGNTVTLPSSGGSGFAVGQHYQGGVIVWVDSTGTSGLIAGLVDIEVSIPWDGNDGGSTNEMNIGNANYDATSFTDGLTNTNNIYAYWGNSFAYAARSCAEYTGGGFSDWYLPSFFEMEIIFANAYVLGNIDVFGTYWTSTEHNPASAGTNTYTLRYDTRGTQSQSQILTFRVRPMRRF